MTEQPLSNFIEDDDDIENGKIATPRVKQSIQEFLKDLKYNIRADAEIIPTSWIIKHIDTLSKQYFGGLAE